MPRNRRIGYTTGENRRLNGDPLRIALERLRRDFPGKSRSWVKRALFRLPYVREVRDGLYVVEGVRELGDWKPLYQVWWSTREGRWECTCYYSTFGWRRRRGICTHVASVLLYRRFKRAVEAVENRHVYFASAEVECVDVKVRGALEHRVVPLEQSGTILDFGKRRRFAVYVVSAEPEVEILCDNAPVKLQGVKVSYKVAKALLQDAQRGDAP